MTMEEALERYTARRDAEAFRILVERYQGLVYSAVSRVLGRREDVEDVTQQTFLKLAQGAGRIRENVGAWLYATAVNGAMDLVRRDATRRRHEARGVVEATESRAEWEEVSGVIDEEIARLPAEMRALIVGHFLEGETHAAIAERVGVNQSTISRRMEGAVAALRKGLAKRGFGEGAVGVVVAGLPKVGVPQAVTGELVKVGLVGAGGKAAGVSIAVMVIWGGIAASVLVGMVVWRVRGSGATISTPPVAATAPTAIPEMNKKTALAELAKTYTLAPDQYVRRIVPPFPEMRETVIRAENPDFSERAIQHMSDANRAFYYLGDASTPRQIALLVKYGLLFSGGSAGQIDDIASFVKTSLRIDWFRIDGLEKMNWQPGHADWIMRGWIGENENLEKRLADWGKIVGADTGKNVTFEPHKVMRPSIIMKTRSHLPSGKDNQGIHWVFISLETPTLEELAQWERHQPKTLWTSDFNDVGKALDAPFFATNNYVGEAFCVMPDAYLDHTQPRYKEDLEKVLANLKEQVGAEWSVEDREIEVWSPVVK